MSLWGYDVVFFRVICISLVAIAFIFTVILTNVFVDVDGYLMPKTQSKRSTETPEATTAKRIKQDYLYEEQNYIDDDSSYRAKRALDFRENISIKRNPNIKMAISNQLAELLEELDDEEPVTKRSTITTTAVTPKQSKQKKGDKGAIDVKGSEEVIHRALHEILLQGIVDHMSFAEIYKKIKNVKKVSKEMMKRQKDRSNEEHQIINEILKCKKLENEVEKLSTEANIKTIEATEKSLMHNDRVIVKSEVQIWNDDKMKQNSTNGKVKGFIKMIYNGKLVNLTEMQNDLVSMFDDNNKGELEEVTIRKGILKYKNKNDDIDSLRQLLEYKANPPMSVNDHSINRLLKRFYLNNKDLYSAEGLSNTIGRAKRQINNHFIENTTNVSKVNSKTAKTEDNKHIDIEIETHFDGKDVKGARKQFISHLIDKIKNALRSDADKINHKIENDLQLKKRKQDPIPDPERDIFKSKVVPPFDHFQRRELDEINKILNDEKIVYDKFEDVTNRKPKFLSSSKTVNSAEMQKVNINYDRVLENSVAKRFQKPIAGVSAENNDINSKIYTNLGNVSLLLKNIDGTGFSVGYNQYLDDPPDKESLKAFTGLENLIKEYHNVYDYNDMYNHIVSHDVNSIDQDNQHKMTKRYDHLSLWQNNKTEKSHNENLLNSFDALKQLKIFKPITVKKIKKIPIYLKFNKRNKRSVSIQKISNVPKHKMNRYIYTNHVNKNNYFIKNRRNRRHIDNIRIIAKNKIIPFFNKSDEEIYLKRDNMHNNKASFMKQFKVNDIIIKTSSDELYDNTVPFNEVYKVQSPSIKSVYEVNPYMGQVMANYPHVFVENSDVNMPNIYENIIFKNKGINSKPEKFQFVNGNKIVTDNNADETLPEVQGIMKAIMPKSQYKIALKILPQNNDTSTHTGFKEIHTSVNKSFEKNGLHYFSLLNLSAVSKVEKLNISTENTTPKVPLSESIHDEVSNQIIKQKLILAGQKRKVDEQLANLVKESKNLDNIINSVDKHLHTNSYIYPYSHNDNDKTYNTENILSKKNNYDISSQSFIDRQYPNAEVLHNSRSQKLKENLAAEILSKIESNTIILQAFLNKLYDKIEIVPQNKQVKKKEQIEPATSNDFMKDLIKVNESVPSEGQHDIKRLIIKLRDGNTSNQNAFVSRIKNNTGAKNAR